MEIQPQILRRFEVISKLGSGNYGVVYKVVQRQTRQQFALKRMLDPFQNLVDARRTYRQIFYLSEAKHPNIVSFHQAILLGKNLYLLFQLCTFDLQFLGLNVTLEPIQLKFIAYQLFRALAFLHSKGIIHRDIKPANLLINRHNCALKVCDFGLARRIGTSEDNKILTSYIASRNYRPPDMLLGNGKQSPAVDIWGVGCILAQLAVGKPLFKADSPYEQLQQIFGLLGCPPTNKLQTLFSEQATKMLTSFTVHKSKDESVLSRCSQDLLQLVLNCLAILPDERISAETALKSPYFDQLRGLEQDRPDTFSMRLVPKESQFATVQQYYTHIKKMTDWKGQSHMMQWPNTCSSQQRTKSLIKSTTSKRDGHQRRKNVRPKLQQHSIRSAEMKSQLLKQQARKPIKSINSRKAGKSRQQSKDNERKRRGSRPKVTLKKSRKVL